MKLHFQRFLFVLLLCACCSCVSVAAEEPPNDWPEVPDTSGVVPEQILQPEMFSDMNYTIMQSIRSVANQGLRAFFIIGGVLLVANLFLGMTAHQRQLNHAVEGREFNREAEAEDMDRNRTEIIRSKMRQKEIDLIANARFRATNHEMLVEDGVHKAELQYSITQRIRELHPDWEMNESVHRMKTNFLADAKFHMDYPDAFTTQNELHDELRREHVNRMREEHPDWDIDDVVHRLKISYLSDARFHMDYPDAYVVKRQLYDDLNQQYYDERRKQAEKDRRQSIDSNKLTIL